MLSSQPSHIHMLHALQSLSQDVWNISSDFLRKQYLLFGLGIVSQLLFSLRYISHVSSHMVFNFAQGFWISNIYSHFKYLPTSVLYSTSLFSGGHNSWALIYLFCSGFGSTRQSLCIINIKYFHYYLLVKKIFSLFPFREDSSWREKQSRSWKFMSNS